MAATLTTGAIKKMLNNIPIDCPVLQITNIKEINGNRHRLYLNDGQYATGASMIAIQLNKMVTENEVDINCIIKVNRYICNTVKGTKRVLVLLEMGVVQSGSQVGSKIGNPTQLTGSEAPDTENEPPNMHNSVQGRATLPSNVPPPPANAKNEPAQSYKKQMPGVHPISSLTPYQNKWTICSRVTNKSDIRRWSNARGEGKLFSVDLIDESGEIRATGFNECCDKFYEFLQIDKVYYISTAQLKTANKQYTTLKNDYEMTFNQGTQITVCEEETAIPGMQYDFKTVEEIESLEKDALVDVIGVCKSFDEVTKIVSKQNQKEFTKRDLQLVDESGKEIRFTLWGATAEKFEGEGNPIIAAKGVKVGDFNGKSLSAMSSSALQYNPDITESHKLRAWFENTGCTMETVNLSNARMGGGGVSASNFKTIGEAIIENLGAQGTADYYSTVAYTTFVRKENCMYAACPADGCNKKVVDMNNGMFRCEKCSKEYDSFNWRLMVSACIADSTNSVWVTAFQDQAEVMLGHTSAELGELKERDNEAFVDLLSKACFHPFTFKIRVKMDTYNEESRLKSSVVSIAAVNYNEYNSALIADIKNMSGMN